MFAHAPRGDFSAEEFFNARDFTMLGVVPRFWGSEDADGGGASGAAGSSSSGDAVVWARTFHDGTLVTFPLAKGESLANLSLPSLKPVQPRCPRWVTTIACQFGLPLGIVGILFAISYILVLLGPLRGISGKYMKDEASVAVEDYVDDGAGDL